jgi:hypothetical protein
MTERGITDDAFENALGGVRALLLEEGDLVGHASVVQRRDFMIMKTLTHFPRAESFTIMEVTGCGGRSRPRGGRARRRD